MPYPIPASVLEFVTTLATVGYDVVIKPKDRQVLVRGVFSQECGCAGQATRAVTWTQLESAVSVNALAEHTSGSILAELASMVADLELEHAQAQAEVDARKAEAMRPGVKIKEV